MADTQQILHHIAELYARPKKDQVFEDAVSEMEYKLKARFNEYEKAFAEKLTSDIIKSIDDYWRFKSDKARPTVAQIMAMFNSDPDVDKDNKISFQKKSMPNVRYFCPEVEFMNRDIALKRCHHTLFKYRRAVNYVLDVLLPQEMPVSEWVKLDISGRYKQAMTKGLFNRLDEILEGL